MKKLLPSPSCSSSSSFSSSSFDPNLCNPKPGCLAGILRRILCSGSLPTHPADQITEETSSVKDTNSVTEGKATAGIVARLMGLDSMPEVKGNPNLVSRSRSMNSVEHFHKYLEGDRRLRSTQSFREMPTFLELENEDFLILSFEEESGCEELRSKQSRSVVNSAEFKQRRGEKFENRGSDRTEQLSERRKKKKKKKRRNDPEKYVQMDLKVMKKSSKEISEKRTSKVDNNGDSEISTSALIENLKVESVAERLTKSRKSRKNAESECGSDESSPVSVLDCSQFLRDPDLPLSGDDSNSLTHRRRKLSPELESLPNPSPRNGSNLIITDRKFPTTKEFATELDKQGAEICRIIETELAESKWINCSGMCQKQEGFEGIFAGFESYILDRLIDEFVEQMYDLPLKNFNL